MDIRSKDLDALRETASKALIGLLWLHVPVAMADRPGARRRLAAPDPHDGCACRRGDRCRGAQPATVSPPFCWSRLR